MAGRRGKKRSLDTKKLLGIPEGTEELPRAPIVMQHPAYYEIRTARNNLREVSSIKLYTVQADRRNGRCEPVTIQHARFTNISDWFGVTAKFVYLLQLVRLLRFIVCRQGEPTTDIIKT